MRRLRLPAAAAALLLACTPLVPAAATGGHHAQPDRIELPDGWQPEGVTTNGRRLFVGSLADGAIWKTNPRTGAGRVLAEGAEGRVAVGLDHDRRCQVLWVAGGPTGEVRAHSARTGDVLATYALGSDSARFLNDVVVTRRGVYVTDSFNQELAVIPLTHRHRSVDRQARGSRHQHRCRSLPKPSAARTLPLTGDLEYVDGFNLNGIEASRGRLLAVQSNTGLLFRINPKTGRTRTVDLGDASVEFGDGLELRGAKLYVVRNQLNLVALVKLDRRLRSGTLRAELTSDDLDVPTTVALVRRSLWAVNARFGTPPTPDTSYWLTRLDAVKH